MLLKVKGLSSIFFALKEYFFGEKYDFIFLSKTNNARLLNFDKSKNGAFQAKGGDFLKVE